MWSPWMPCCLPHTEPMRRYRAIVDIRDADALAPLLSGVDLVCHQAAVVGAGVNTADAPDYGSHNDFGTPQRLRDPTTTSGPHNDFGTVCCWRRCFTPG